jgi:hypothetical protein
MLQPSSSYRRAPLYLVAFFCAIMMWAMVEE